MANPHAFHEIEHAGAGVAPATVDIGLRAYMLRVYNYVAGGLALTGAEFNPRALALVTVGADESADDGTKCRNAGKSLQGAGPDQNVQDRRG